MGAAVPLAAAAAADRQLEVALTDASFRKRILGPDFGLKRHDLIASNETLKIPNASKGLLRDIVTLRTASPPGTPRIAGKRRKVEALVHRLESDVVADTRKRAAANVRRSMVQIRPAAGAGGSNLIVMDDIARLWSREPVELRKETSARRGFRVEADPRGTPILVERTDGTFTPVVPYAGLYVVVKRGTTGDVLQAYGQQKNHDAYKGALEAITDFAAGRIGADRIDELAARLRTDKHADPALGVICAYLYRAIADFDSIRRMANFFVQHDQPVPFDIALLGAMKVTRGANGAPRLHVPAVKARKRQGGAAGRPVFATAATPARQAWVGGRCPWLGLGWDYVRLPRPEWAALVEGLADHAPEVRRSGFTVLPSEIGVALAKSWKLQPR